MPMPIVWAFRPALSRLQNISNEQPICRCCRSTTHIAASSLLRRACAVRLISLMTSSRREYYCSSLCRPVRHRLPHRLSNEATDGWPYSPTVYSRQRPSTVLIV